MGGQSTKRPNKNPKNKKTVCGNVLYVALKKKP